MEARNFSKSPGSRSKARTVWSTAGSTGSWTGAPPRPAKKRSPKARRTAAWAARSRVEARSPTISSA